MSPARRSLLALCAVGLFAACSSSSTPSTQGGQGGDGGDSGSSSGGTEAGGVEAGEAGGTACTGPGGCSGSTPVCCATVPLTTACTSVAPAAPVCKAAASCATSVGMHCPGTQTVRLCASNSDCTEPAFNLCCFFPPLDAGVSLQFCANQTIAAFAGAGAVCQ